MTVKLHSFLIQGGDPFSLKIHHPQTKRVHRTLDHRGKKTLFKFIGTDEQASELNQAFVSSGAYVKWDVLDSPASRAQPTFLFQTLKCKGCYFMDPDTTHKCGVVDWNHDTVNAALTVYNKAQADLEACPLYGESSNPIEDQQVKG